MTPAMLRILDQIARCAERWDGSGSREKRLITSPQTLPELRSVALRSFSGAVAQMVAYLGHGAQPASSLQQGLTRAILETGAAATCWLLHLLRTEYEDPRALQTLYGLVELERMRQNSQYGEDAIRANSVAVAASGTTSCFPLGIAPFLRSVLTHHLQL